MININKVFKPLYTSKKRYFLLTGGRGSLKSTSVHDFISRMTSEKGHGILFLRYTMTSAEKSIIPEFKEAIQRNNSYNLFEFKGDKVTNTKTGSFIIFAGIKTSSGNQTATLKSIPGLTTMVVEEGEDFADEKTFDVIDDSIRSNEAQNRVIWIMNPTTPEHFIYKRWIAQTNKNIQVQGHDVTISDHPDVEHIHTTYHLTERAGYLPQSWLDKAEKAKEENPKWYYHNYIGGWLEKAEGVILPNWREGKFDTSLPFCHSMDFGFSPDPTTLIKIAVDKKKMIIYVAEKYHKTEMSTGDIKTMLDTYTEKTDLTVADSAEMRLINELISDNYNVTACHKYPGSVKIGLKKLVDYTIVVCGDSPNIKIELNNYIWNDKKAGIPIDKYNHCFVGDTFITTDKGLIKIKEICIGDNVLTSNGYRRVLKTFDNGIQQVTKYSMQLDTKLVTLTGTKEHKIKTNLGWKEISKLKKGMQLYLHKHSMVNDTISIKARGISARGLNDYIELFGNITKAAYQKVITCIISTAMLPIMQSKIFHLFPHRFTFVLQANNDSITTLNGLKISINLGEKHQKNGTQAKKGENGIVSNQKKVVLIDRIKNLYATIAVKSTKQDTEGNLNIATTIADLQHLGRGLERVYDLTVEGQYEYYANGILVHNCIDPIRYGFDRLTTSSGLF